MKNIIVLIIVVVAIVFGAVTFLDFRNKGKYEECKKACEYNNTCLEYGDVTNYMGNKQNTCLKMSSGDCLNLCVQKYK